jgi:ribonuclease P protein component
MPAFVLEARARSAAETAPSGPRFGFTITKKIGGAVVRNRIRRRLRALAAGLAQARADYDYVLIARPGAIDRGYQDLKADLEQALDRIHRAGASPRPSHGRT